MQIFGFFLKTYSADYSRVVRLIDSYKKNNIESLPMYIACPKKDISLFQELQGENIFLIEEETICENVFTEDTKMSAGYLNQQIYKLAFWEKGLCANYMCLDSDAIFIRPFYKKDFMYDEDVPYTTLVEDNDLQADLYYNKWYWNNRREEIRKIENEIEFHPYHLLTCHGFQIFSGRALKSLRDDFMVSKGYTYKDLIRIAPYEFSWYNLWVQKTNVIPIHYIEPLFKCFHMKQHHVFYVLQGMKLEDWAKGYIGIIVNSNYAIGSGDYNDISVYKASNISISRAIINLNLKFYRRLKREKITNKISEAFRNGRRGQNKK